MTSSGSHPRPSSAVLRVACALIRDGEGRYLAGRRGPGLRDAGAWEFPGGKIEDGESPRACVERELREELGVRVDAGEPAFEAEAAVPAIAGERVVRLYACPALPSSPPPYASSDHDELRFLTLAQMGALPTTAAEAALLAAMEAAAEEEGPRP